MCIRDRPEGLKSYIAHDELLALPGIVQLDEETYEYEGATLYVFDSYEGMAVSYTHLDGHNAER